jgi:Trans-2-enoyl-CoA reductase catalytic region
VFEDGVPKIGGLHLPNADDAEREATARVGGSADRQMRIGALQSKGLLADGFQTVALSYVGSDITAPIYRVGTTGATKQHLDAARPQGLPLMRAPRPGPATTDRRSGHTVVEAGAEHGRQITNPPPQTRVCPLT